MNLPVSIAEKLLLLQNGEKIPYSKLKHEIVTTMLENGILERQIMGRSKKMIFSRFPDRLNDYLFNHFSISNLQAFINLQRKENVTRSELIAVSSNSKLRKVRTFKGFLVNCYSPIQTTINGKSVMLNPAEGMFQFIYDFESFTIPQNITIVGVENPENFRHIGKQKDLFENIKPLFVSRYPQNKSKDLIKWLQFIPNNYLHFGDFDFAGIGIYLNEYKKYLTNKASFFVPENVEDYISEYGNKILYDKQKINFNMQFVKEENLVRLVEIIHKYKKGLEQEIWITT
jgi:hypothetical protein